MKTIPLLTIFLVLLLPVSFGQTSPPVYKLDTKSWPTQTIALDKILKEIRVIPLETKPECMIGYIGHLLMLPDVIVLVNTNPYQALCFDLKGKFLRKMGAVGKGPGEYQSVSNVLPNREKSEILLYDFRQERINFFNMAGGFLRRTILSFRGIDIRLVDNNFLAIHAGRMGINQEEFELAVLKQSGEIQKTFFPFSVPIGADCCCGFADGIQPNSVLYHKAFDYRIYEVFADRVTTLLTLDFGSATLDSAKYMNQREFTNSADDKGKVIGFLGLTNTIEHLAANILIGNLNRGTWVLDHRSKKHQFLAADPNEDIGTFKGIPVPCPKETDGSWFIASEMGINWNEAISKLTEAQKVILRKEVSGFIESEKVAVDGNPVLVLYRFREF